MYCDPFAKGTRVTQPYGAGKNTGFNGPAGHSGKDYGVPVGTPIRAAADGIIEYAGEFDDTYADNLLWLIDFGGKIIVLDAGAFEPTFVYAHLSRFLVKSGDKVKKGQVIGISGNTGKATTGAHCHVECFRPGYVLNSPSLGRTDPDMVFDEYWDESKINVEGSVKEAVQVIKEVVMTIREEDFNRIFVSGNEDADKVINTLEPKLDKVIELLTKISEDVTETKLNVRKTVYKLKAENATAVSEK